MQERRTTQVKIVMGRTEPTALGKRETNWHNAPILTSSSAYMVDLQLGAQRPFVLGRKLIPSARSTYHCLPILYKSAKGPLTN